MPRAKSGYKSRRRRNRIRKHAKGFRGGRSKLWKAAVEAVHRTWRYALFHRRKRKRDFRGLWIMRINAAAREHRASPTRKLIAALDKAQHRARSQDPLGPRDQRSRRLQEGRRDGAAPRPSRRAAARRQDRRRQAARGCHVQRGRHRAQLDRRARSAGRRVRGRDRRARRPSRRSASRRRATSARRARSPS